MAELSGLEEDLTCSICLSTFQCPVTIPCGHNFCHECLQASWSDGAFCCPQCRASFSTRPELKKNTVLSTIVETFSSQVLPKCEKDTSGQKVKVETENGVICDTCMEAEASRTCLTCMASFCEEHLKPHQMNPVFSLHQLSLPVSNLLEWVCKSHHKLMEFFCSQHGQTICSLCLQQEHKGCSFTSTEEHRNLKKVSLEAERARRSHCRPDPDRARPTFDPQPVSTLCVCVCVCVTHKSAVFLQSGSGFRTWRPGKSRFAGWLLVPCVLQLLGPTGAAAPGAAVPALVLARLH